MTIREVQVEHPDLSLSLTVPVGPSGLASSGVKLLRAAATTRVRVDLVNIMTMDFGGRDAHMGRTAIRAGRGTIAQLCRIWPDAGYPTWVSRR